MHNGDTVGKRHRLHLVMGHINRGGAVLDMQALEFRAHSLAQFGIERADWLVHQHGFGAAHERAPNSDPLHVAARKRRWPELEQMLDADGLDDAPDFSVDDFYVLAGCPQRKGDVFIAGQMRIQREKLEDKGNVAVSRLQALHGLAVNEDIAGVNGLKAGDGAQRRCLAAARWPEQDHEFTILDVKVEFPDDVTRSEIFFDVAQDYLGHCEIAQSLLGRGPKRAKTVKSTSPAKVSATL